MDVDEIYKSDADAEKKKMEEEKVKKEEEEKLKKAEAEELEKAKKISDRLDKLEKSVKEFEELYKSITGKKEDKEIAEEKVMKGLPDTYPYPAKKAVGEGFEGWANMVAKSIEDINHHLGLDDDPEIETLKKAVDERDIKIKELSDRLEKVEQMKEKKALSSYAKETDRPSYNSHIVVRDGQVFTE